MKRKNHPKLTRAVPLFVAQALVAFNDNALKLALFGLAGMTLSAAGAELATTVLAFLLIFPFVVFAPLAGWVSDRFSRTRVLRSALLTQIAALGIVYVGTMQREIVICLVGFALLAIQSTFFSPAKRAILKDLVGTQKLPQAVGIGELVVMISIMVGSFIGGYGFDQAFAFHGDSAWRGMQLVCGVLAGVAFLSYLSFLPVPYEPAKGERPFKLSLTWGHVKDIAFLWNRRPLWLAGLGNAVVWALGGALMLVIMNESQLATNEQGGSATVSGLMMVYLGVGIALGSVLAGWVNRKGLVLGGAPFALAGVTVALLVMSCAPFQSFFFCSALLVTGICASLFMVPVSTFLQDRSDTSFRGRVLAAENLIINACSLTFIGVQYVMGQVFDWSASTQFLFFALFTTVVGFYSLWLLRSDVLRLIIRVLVKTFYRLKVKGLEHLPETGRALIIGNHMSWADAVILSAVSSRPIRFLSYDGLLERPFVKHILKMADVIPVSAHRAKDAIRKAADSLQRDELVCIFPEGHISRSGRMEEFKRGFELIAKMGDAPVIPVYLDGLWGSIFSFSGGRFFKKIPKSIPYPVGVHWGAPLSAEELSPQGARQRMMSLGEDAFTRRTGTGLAQQTALALASRKEELAIVDHSAERREMTSADLLARAVLLSQKIRKDIPEKRIGIILTPGIEGTLANLAVVFAGKIPVNLNMTLGVEALLSCIQKAGLRSCISTGSFIALLAERHPALATSAKLWEIDQESAALTQSQLRRVKRMVRFTPKSCWLRLLQISPALADEEAILLFTSGSSGLPKGVVLSHRNVISNCMQIAESGALLAGESVLANLPLFHSFGATISLWCSLLNRVKLVTVASPLDYKNGARAIAEEQVGMLFGTPTFLRPYLKRAEPEALQSLKAVIVGAEKTPDGFAEAWEARFKNCRYFEGYGLTETAPVVSVNAPDFKLEGQEAFEVLGSRPKSAGKLVPGVTVRIQNPDTGELVAPGEVGLLLVRGPNVFSGYLDDESKTKEAFSDGWYITGDLARLDSDGFLFIEGRLSRFSKIGGEMVPHGAVEDAVMKALDCEAAEVPQCAIVGKPDSEKGEVLCLVTAREVDLSELRKALLEMGLAALWIPKKMITVKQIPLLGTGKLDLKALSELAEAE